MTLRCDHFLTHISTKLHQLLVSGFLVIVPTHSRRDTQTERTKTILFPWFVWLTFSSCPIQIILKMKPFIGMIT